MNSGAIFTMRLKDVFKATGGTWDSSNGLSVLTGGDIGLDYYPLFSDLNNDPNTPGIPNYRPVLNGKIFDHFMNREIGYESIGLFHLGMRRKMNEIMPYMNQMYNSLAVEINPISTTDLVTANTDNRTQASTQNADTSSTSASNGASRNVSSETPQTELSGLEDYATSASDVNSQSNTTGSGTNTTTGSTTDDITGNTTITGYQGSPANLLMTYRESFINIDMSIINELEELFIQVWSNGDSFSDRFNYEGYVI